MTTDKLGGRKTLAVDGFLEEFEKDEIKARVDIVALFGSFGIELAPRGKSFCARCPWHEDKEPSLSVDREKGLYHCFGCGESGDAVSLVQKIRGVGFREALEYLKAHGATTPDERRMSRPSVAHRMQETRAAPEAAESSFVLDDVAARYASALAAHPDAQAYLASRGLDRPELIAHFRVGYCDGKLSEVLGASQKAELRRLGVLKASGSEHFAKCITFPLFDDEGHVVGFYGRRIITNSRPAHLYLTGPHKGLFNREAAKVHREEVILTESLIDAASLIALGIPNAIPCYGANGFTAEHERLLADERVKSVVIGFDADEAGRRGAEALAERLQHAGLTVKTAAPPKGKASPDGAGAPAFKDWNEYLVAGGTAEELKALFEQAPLVGRKESASAAGISISQEGERKVFEITGVRYKVSGARELFVASLRVNIRAETDERKYIDNVDLLSARSRQLFSQSMAELTGLESPRVERDLVAILEHLEAERDKRLSTVQERPQAMSEEERRLGMEFLSAPDLVERVASDLDALGYVGERENKLLVYLSATSRRMEDPLSVLIVSESASGKSFLIDTVKRLMPPEEVVAMTSLSDQALQYLPEDALLHKFLVMGEAVHSLVVEHQVREMLSSRELSRLVTLKDERTGELQSRMVRKPVVVSCALSTTNPQVNPENASRFFVVGADESEAQTRAIFDRQKGKYTIQRYRDGEKEVQRILSRHRAAQRLLAPRIIVNPFARVLEFPSRLMRSRRDHERFLDLIAAVCFLRQYLKQEKEHEGVRYIECDLTDYTTAYALMLRVIASTYGAIPPQALAVYEALRDLAKKKADEQGVEPTEIAVSQRELREMMGIGAMTVKRSLRLLIEYEYLGYEGSRRRGARLGYRLLRDEQASESGAAGIPGPEEVAGKLQNLESGSTGSEWVKSGADPLFGT